MTAVTEVARSGWQIAAPAAPPGTWRNITAAAGLPRVRAESGSARDVDSDGTVDILISAGPRSHSPVAGGERPWVAPELFLGSARGPFRAIGLAGQVRGEPILDHVTATTIADADGDGRRDLLLGGYHRLQILYQEDDLTFRAETHDFEGRVYGDVRVLTDSHASAIGVFDLDGDGLRDVLVAMRRQDQRLDGIPPPRASDVLLLGRPDGFVDASLVFQPLLTCSSGLSFGFTWIPRGPLGADDLLYMGVDTAPDCLFTFDRADGGLHVGQASLPPIGLGDPWRTNTMGVDHAFVGDDGGVIIAISDLGRVPVIYVPPDGPVVDLTSSVALGAHKRTSWGLALHDADLDGVTDMTVAFGSALTPPPGAVVSPDLGIEMLQLNSLRHFAGALDEDGLPRFEDVGARAGVEFTPGHLGVDAMPALLARLSEVPEVEALRYDYYSLVALDGDRDGCSDLLATPRLMFDRVEEDSGELVYDYSSEAVVTLLRGSCDPANQWVGLVLPDAPGALVRLTALVDGKPVTRIQQVKVAPGVASIGEVERLRFGFGPSRVELQSLRVDWPGGRVTEADLAAATTGTWYRVPY